LLHTIFLVPMKSLVKTSLLISTYNWPMALNACLHSVVRQQQLPNEVVICDDGSREETASLIKKWQKNFPVPLHHVWHPDDGFRLSAIRNKGIAKCSGDYIIQIDGDIVLHPYFVNDHNKFARHGFFVCGNRYDLTDTDSQLILQTPETIPSLFSVSKQALRKMHLPLLHQTAASLFDKKYPYLYVAGCNMAFWKKDLFAVNGYDESFVGWGFEDSDIFIRLTNQNIKHRFLRFGGIQYHLHHKENDRSHKEENIRLLQEAVATKRKYATLGLSQYHAPGKVA